MHASRTAVTAWTPEMARLIEPGAATTAPVIDAARLGETLPGYYVWDCWPVREPDGSLAVFDGQHLWVALTAPDDVHPDDRHHVAELRAALAEPDGAWHDQGPLFPPGTALGSRQWAGSTVHDPATGTLTAYYTATGRTGDAEISFEQRIVAAAGRLRVSGGKIELSGWTEHREPFEADGRYYKSTRGTGGGPGMIDAFRDPAYFLDPATGARYLLFTATVAGVGDEYDGAVGVARALDDRLSAWELRPPLLHAVGVDNELERPHVVVKDGRYYLFFSTQAGTFKLGLPGVNGLYGFVAERFDGPYMPLNESGLVIANPPEEPLQAYSWLVLNDGWTVSFLDYHNLGGRRSDSAQQRDPEFHHRHFGGRLAPFLRIELDGDRTRIVEERYPSGGTDRTD